MEPIHSTSRVQSESNELPTPKNVLYSLGMAALGAVSLGAIPAVVDLAKKQFRVLETDHSSTTEKMDHVNPAKNNGTYLNQLPKELMVEISARMDKRDVGALIKNFSDEIHLQNRLKIDIINKGAANIEDLVPDSDLFAFLSEYGNEIKKLTFQNLNSADSAALVKLCPNLISLKIETPVQENFLKTLLSSTEKLESLHLKFKNPLDPRIFENLGAFANLADLSLGLDSYKKEVVLPLSSLQNLQSLSLDFEFLSSISNKDIDTLTKQMGGLTKLHTHNAIISQIGAQTLVNNLPKLNSLRIQGSIGKDGLRAISSLKNLTCLYLKNSYNIDALASRNIKDGVHYLAEELENLTDLTLINGNITDREVRSLAKLKNLRRLNLRSNDITGDGLQNLTSLPLAHLDLSHNRLSNEGISNIAKLLDLEELRLENCQIDNMGSLELTKLKKLTHLDLSSNLIQDEGAIGLARFLKNLTYLNLENCFISIPTSLKIRSQNMHIRVLRITSRPS